MKNRKLRKLWGIPLFIAIFAALVWVTMLLWNALLPAIFGIVTIDYWQALGLLVLGRLLFGGFGKGGGGMHHFRRRHHGCHGHGKDDRFRGFGERGGDGRFGGRSFANGDAEEFMREGGDDRFASRGGDPFRKMRDKMKSMTKEERREFFHNRLHNQHILWEEMLDDFDNSDKKADTDEQR